MATREPLPRTFLIYELAGRSHFTEVGRQINHQPPRAGMAASSTGSAIREGGLQVEEIAPEWLSRGNNTIHFAAPTDAVEYRVRKLRVVAIPYGGIVSTARLTAAQPTEIALNSAMQAREIGFYLERAGTGTLVVGARGHRVHIPLAGRAVGWQRAALDGFPSVSAITMALMSRRPSRQGAVPALVRDVVVSGDVLLPAAPKPEVVISFPRHGECDGDRMQLQGFVRGADPADPLRGLAVAGDPVRVGPDGSFNAQATVLAASAGVPVAATFARAGVTKMRISASGCGAPADPGLSRDEGAPYGAVVRAGEAKTIRFAGARLDIPKGAVERDVRITIRPLVAGQVRPMAEGFTNVSPDGRAFRFGPHGLKFKKPITVTLPYDARSLGPGMRERQIFGFFYDEGQKKWTRVGRYGTPERGELASLSEHFTDFVNATVAMPDSPGVKAFGTTEMSGVKLGSPAAGVDLIEAPVANATGDARLHLPLELPPGRNGIEPHLAFTYSNRRDNGWLGVGWDLSLSSIEIDTRFGVPDYASSTFSDRARYLLDGDALVPDGRDAAGHVSGFYRRRVEGRFDRIERLRDAGGCVTGFVVTDKQGTRLTYGGTDATLADPKDGCRAFRWHLASVQDTFGNTMALRYFADRDTSGDGYVALYPQQVDYTSHKNGLAAAYHVLFALGPADDRGDILVNGRAGFQVRTRYRLDHVDVAFNSEVIRRYQLIYAATSATRFYKSVINAIAVMGLHADRLLDQHTFEYHQAPTSGAQSFGAPQLWGTMANDAHPGLTNSEDHIGGAGASFGVGFGGGDSGSTLSVSVSGGGSGGETRGRRAQPDINGDGLPDFVDDSQKNGLNLLRPWQALPSPTGGHLQPGLFSLPGSGTVGHSRQAGFNVSVDGNAYGVLGAGQSFAMSWLKDDRILADIDGDGRPDVVTIEDGRVSWSRNSGCLGTVCNYEDARVIDTALQPTTAVGNADLLRDAAAAGSLNRVGPLVRWTAPFDGSVTFGGPLQKLNTRGVGIEAAIYRCRGGSCASPELVWRRVIASSDLTICVPSGASDCGGQGVRLNVSRGDRIYTRLLPVHDVVTPPERYRAESVGNEVAWNPTIVYDTPASLATLKEPFNVPIYRFERQSDFQLVGRPSAPWVAHSKGTVHIDGTFVKEATSDDVMVKITKFPGGQPICSGGTSIYKGTFGGDTAQSQRLTFDVEVAANDRILVELSGGTLVPEQQGLSYHGGPIDPRRIHWQPTVTYTSMCRTDLRAAVPTEICGAVSCDANAGTCAIANDDPDASYLREVIVQSPLVFTHVPFIGVTAPTQPFVADASGTLTLNGTVSSSVADVDLLIQGVNRLYYKQRLHTAGQAVQITDLQVPVQAGDEIFVTLYSGSGQVVGPGQVTGSISSQLGPLPINTRWRDLSLGDEMGCLQASDDPMSGGYHNWFYGFYDGEVPLSEAEIAFPYGSDGKPNGKKYLVAFPALKKLSDAADAPLVPLWLGSGNAYIADSQQTATRTMLGAGAGSSSGGEVGSLRAASTWNLDLRASAIVSIAYNHGQTDNDHDFFDFNGDHYPDNVKLDGSVDFMRVPDPADPVDPSCRRPPCIAFETRQVAGISDSKALHRAEHGAIKFGIGGNNQMFTKAKTDGKSKGTGTMGFELSARYGATTGSIDWVDVNGDGLPDLVTRQAQHDQSYRVRLNYGYRLGQEVTWPATQWSIREPLYASGVTVNMPSGFTGLLSFPGSYVGLNGVRAQDSTSFSGSLAAGGSSGGSGGGVSAGFSYTTTRTLVDTADVNGDGLPDQIMKVPQTGALLVRFNRGNRFDDEEVRLVAPGWSTACQGEDCVYQQLGDVNDSIEFDRAKSFDLGVNVQYCIFIFCIGVNAFYSNAKNWADTKLEDVNGDGLPDMVLHDSRVHETWVKLNLLNGTDEAPTPVNTLKTVHRPLGGTIELSYARAGNLVLADRAPTVDEPTNQYVLAKAVVTDGRGSRYERGFSYDPSGFYDRDEREQYGFAKVVTTREGQSSTMEEGFFNHDFYRKGLPAASVTRDPAQQIYGAQELVYADPSGVTAGRDGWFFPAKVSETTKWYEGLTSDVSAPLKTRTNRYTGWDVDGNLVDYETLNDVGGDDDVFYHVDYDEALKAQHIFRPREVKAHAASPSGPILRDRLASYEAHGALQSLTNVLVGGKDPASGQPYNGTTNPTWSYGYDEYGNAVTVVDPRGYTLRYTFDDVARGYRTSTSDSFGYRSMSIPNYYFGSAAAVTDENGNMELFNYDDFGRLSTVYGPTDLAGSGSTANFCAPGSAGLDGPTLVFCYSEGEATPRLPAFAVTRHKDVQHPGDPLVTSTFVDGLGRMLQTKQDLERDAGSGTQVGMSVSGAVTFDTVGRLAEQDQPVFDPGSDPTVYYIPPVAPGRPTRFGYDILDRQVSLRTPDGALTTTSYGVEPLDGVPRLTTTVHDANVNGGGGLPGAERKTFSDVRGLVMGVKTANRLDGVTATALVTRYTYDPMEELTQVSDTNGNLTAAEYDTVGHLVALNSPDAGRTEWRYDLSGNMGAKETARLRQSGQLIRYEHEFNRLKSVVYPTSTAVVYEYGAPAEAGDGFFNLAGRVKSETSEAGRRDYQYDALGSVTQEHWRLHPIKNAADVEHTTGYTHDAFGRLLTVAFGDAAAEVLSYRYDHGGKVNGATGVNGNPSLPGTTVYVADVGYDEYGERTRLVHGNGIVTRYQYDPVTRRLVGVDADQRDPRMVQHNLPARPFERLRYAYDLVGNITARRNDAPYDDSDSGPVLPGTVAEEFGYDDQYQLKTASGLYQETAGWKLRYGLRFGYDALGNILSKAQANDRLRPNQTQPQNDTSYVASYSYAGPRPHAPTQVNETIAGRVYPRALSYDADGDQTGWVYGTATRRENDWNEEDRLQAVRGNGVELARALYDGEGQRRVSHQRGGSGGSAQETAYFSANVTLRDGRYVTKHVFLGDTRIASKMEASTPNQAPTTLYFHDDSLGSTHFLTDGDQALVAHEEYFPTGELWVDEAERKFAERQAYLFNGKELDAGTGLYYYGARYYDARLSQWNSPDPVLRGYLSGMGNGGVYRPENLGLYTYTWNSPVVLKDPDGSCPLCVTAGAGALIGGAISGGTRLASNYASGRPLLQGVGASMVGGAVSGALIGLTAGAGGAAVGLGTMLGDGAVAATAGGVAERAVEHGLDSAQVFDVKAMAGDAVAGAAGAGLGAGLGALSKQLGQAGRSAVAQAETSTTRGVFSTADDLASAAGRARATVGPGRGPVYGTRAHSAFRAEVEALGNPNLSTEVSYLNGRVVPYGTRGSVRLDVVGGPLSAPTAIYDFKTGSAALSPARIAQIRAHLPGGGSGVPVLEVR